ncbi:DUF1002 domain-containing protein [Shouchella patagoniensis]|uniref:DUF1002 domain-containing protein n=1 Tax=Shouchella patagoniensis TaxID=228576 RepID=UPI000995D963|nr:DUF1002 domain-containing protein [Shouchella patagoniensis]
MKVNRKLVAIVLSLAVAGTVFSNTAKADTVPGDVFITLGEDLTSNQKNEILQKMGVTDDVETLYVTNEEEHLYLGEYISAKQIGSRALSSSKIMIGKGGTGIQVKADEINWVTNEMYANALITAGVKDAEVYVTAPFEVSGTAALTGLIKAYETAANIDIPEEQKNVANEEMIRTAELADSVGNQDANELIIRIKEKIATTDIKTEDEMRTIILQLAEEINITLSEEETNELTALFMKMKELDIDWNGMKDQLDKARENLAGLLDSEEAQSFFDGIVDALKRFFNSIRDAFRS